MKTKKKCEGCEQEFTLSTAIDETKFCSQLCESGKYKAAAGKLKR